ncbi:hypothetical protein [Aureitalea marina]|uniref:TonB-dependent receptor n=1 Tax=Aureitalea marina TaxID=930804 RepID=A0A2S7KM89_9FLAO|nr:hypothetical protein [Aureitalea marina]PQB03744.1 hypothetical protein BST85_01615 [Aureitalea marina]
MTITKLLLLFIFFCSFRLLAQEKIIDGQIANEVDIEGIHILNQSSGYNTVTDDRGRFRIQAKIGDTLFISSIRYQPTQQLIDREITEAGKLEILLKVLVNELDEVVLGHQLSGNIQADIKTIKVVDTLNFDDVGIPGFKGNPQERIVPTWQAVIPTSVNLEAIYKHISGYYAKLKKKRKWEAQQTAVARMINFYTPEFFRESYGVPTDRVYDFLLFCIETTSVRTDFLRENYAGVLDAFKSQGAIYVKRLKAKAE